MDNVRELRSKLAQIKADAEKMNDTAKAEVRDLTADEQKAYDGLIDEGKAIRAKIDAVEAGRDRGEELGNIFGEIRKGGHSIQVDDSNEYRKAFIGYLKSGEMRYGQSVGQAADGGYLVPEDWADQIVKSAVKEAGIAPNSRQETTGSNEKTIIVRQAIPTAAQADELGTSYSGTGYAVGNATFSQETIALHKATQSIPVSEEILTDSYFNFQNEVIDAGATAIQELVGSWLANGTGTKQPYGLFATAGTGKTTASSGTIVKADLTALKNSVKNTYRRVGKWIMNDATLGVCEAIVDSFGQSIVQERTNGEYWMLNRQIVIDENSPDIGSGTKAIAFGDLSRAYCVVTKPTGLSIKVDPYTNSSNGVTLYHFNMRVGGKIVLAEAVQVMVIKA